MAREERLLLGRFSGRFGQEISLEEDPVKRNGSMVRKYNEIILLKGGKIQGEKILCRQACRVKFFDSQVVRVGNWTTVRVPEKGRERDQFVRLN